MKNSNAKMFQARRRVESFSTVVCIMACFAFPDVSSSTPPDYSTFGRAQRIDHSMNVSDTLRIWVVYVDQGDGILIQLPTRYNYDPEPDDGDPTRSERVDILVDGGSSPVSERWRIAEFLETVYDGTSATIEHVVITHHDQDHVAGLTYLLEETNFGVENIYHNGLVSYRGGARFDSAPNFPISTRPQNAIYKWSSGSGRVTRGMAFLQDDGILLRPEYLINSIGELRAAFTQNKLHGVYEDLGAAVLSNNDPVPAAMFDRARVNRPFIAEREAILDRGVDLDGISLEVIWPREVRQYGNDWGETINGNSITFRLTYGDFQMLFTGDHNERSEEVLVELLDGEDQLELLECDVLKVPHHGSSHAYEEFFRQVSPVVSVASMGERGFKSKSLPNGSRNWQHPSANVIKWLGGSHRVYHTLIHERRFKWDELDTRAKHDAMMEYSHVLVETDGQWFRVVEISDTETNLNSPPTVQQTRRGNGTRWIRAR